MAIEKSFKVRYGLSVGDDLVTVNGTTGDITTTGVVTVDSVTINGTPTATTDAVTKGYVDTAVSSGVGFSGDYNDLTNVPTFATVATTGDYDDLTGKPTLFSGSYTDLTNKPTIPAAQIQSDWTQTTNTSLDYIKNKPTLFSGAYADLTGKPTLFDGAYSSLTGKPTLFSGSYTDLTDKPTLFSGAYADLTGKPTLATVATTGSYTDLTDKPSIPSLTGYATESYVNTSISNLVDTAPTTLDTLNELAQALGDDANFSTTVTTAIGLKANSADLATVATTGAYSDLTGKPTLFSGSYTDLTNKPTLFSGAYADLTGKPTLFSGSYTDLTNKPTIPDAQIQSDWNQTVNTSLDYIKNKPTLFSGAYADLTGKPTLFDGAYSSLTGAPSLATVATTGAYSDLTGKPTLFSGSYTDLTNKPTLFSGAYADLTGKPTLFSGSYTDLTDKPTLFSGAYADLTGKPTSITSFGITDGTSGQVLTTNGTGTFTFTTVTSGLTETDVTKVFASVRNVQGATITKGQVVYLYGATGDTATVKLADADADISSATTMGLVYDTSIANGNIGYVITQGLITGVNTAAFAAGDIVYLSPTAGGLTNVKPVAPVHSVFIGVVVKSNSNSGEIYIKPQNGYELDELHNVDLTTTPPTNGQVLTYNSSTQIWTAQTPSSSTGSGETFSPFLLAGM